MSFKGYFRFSSYMLVICGFSSLVITGFYSFIFALFFALIIYYSWSSGSKKLRLNPPRWLWNVATVIYFAYAVFEVIFRSQDLIGEGIHFTVYLLINKLLNLKENRDYFQMYLLSFINLLSASILTESVSFSIPFLIYIIIATWTFALYNLKVQFEESTEEDKEIRNSFYNSKTVITKKFLLATSILSIVLILSTSVIFLIFPRMSLGFFYRNIGSRQNISGFSEEISLGSIGSIIKSASVVMRVEGEGEKLTQSMLDEIYWRGTAFDLYDGKKWSRTDKEKEKKLIDVLTGVVKFDDIETTRGLFKQKIFLEPMNTRIVFSADETVALRWEKLKIERYMRKEIGVERDSYGTNYFFTNLASDQNYFAYSNLRSKTKYVPSDEEASYPQDLVYLKLPYLDEKVKKLVSAVIGDRSRDYDRATAIEEYLQKNFSYSDKDIKLDEKSPLESFLFEAKKGHCELFSTGMAIMLRYAGIPSRNVVGFRGGSINDVGGYGVVRQSDAHSWVEAYIQGNGWMRFDPTPRASEEGMFRDRKFGFLTKYLDYVKMRWYKYVIDYDLRSQARYARLFFTGAKKFFTLASDSGSKDSFKYKFPKRYKSLGTKVVLPFILIIFVVLLSVFLFRKYSGNRKKTKVKKAIWFYARMLQILSRKGIVRNRSKTPAEFALEIISDKGVKYSSVWEITKEYYDVRYGLEAKDSVFDDDMKEKLLRLKEVR